MKNATRSNIYVCGNPRGFDEFTPVAVVLEKTEKTVTYARYLAHGELYDSVVTIPLFEFDAYYHPVNAFEYGVLKMLGYMKIAEDYDEDSFGGLICDE